MGVCGYDLQVAIYKIEFEIGVNTRKINTKIESQGYVHVLVVDSPISLTEKAAYYAVSEAVVVTPVRDGMNLIPYEYVVNPWDVSAIAEGMNAAISASDHEKEYVHKLSDNAYRGAKSRAILLPFLDTQPSENLISVIKQLCDDPKNTVCVINRRGKESLDTCFDSCGKLAVAAKHGYFMRAPGDAEWKTCGWNSCVGWMENVELIMNFYGEAASDGSYIERKESAMVWHYKNAGGFGQEQAMDMLEHLEKVLANVSVAVEHGQDFVEIKPKGVNKGTTATKIFELMAEVGRSVDFVLGIGDDTSD
ncbi:probable alpha,alpha-trehalose-phosphate synthase [UDP-forming] 7 [Tanacetum coccineum]